LNKSLEVIKYKDHKIKRKLRLNYFETDKTNRSLHIIYALKSGGGENVLKKFISEGDLCISLTKNSCLEKMQIKLIPFRINSEDSYYSLYSYLKSIPSLVYLFTYLLWKKKQYKIVFHGFPFQFIVFLISNLKENIKVYFVYHQFKKDPNTIFGHFSIFLERIFLNLSKNTHIVGVSPWVVYFISKNFKPRRKVKLLNVPITVYPITQSSTNLLGKYLIYGARLVKEKGQLRLLKDIYKMNIDKPNINKIIFCGSGDIKKEINQYAKSNLKNFDIKILNNLAQSDYQKLLQDSEGFLFPSYREAFPLSLLESVLLCKKVFIWEEYLYKYYEDCCYSSKYLELLLRGKNLPLLSCKENRKNQLKSKHLINSNFIDSIN
tara:strand:+ start:15730 stop:16860 length:1131 start_codon:yes stop_codon:yes gene_type:complete